MNKAIRYGLVNGMTGLTCSAIMATTWDGFAKTILVGLVVVIVSILAGLAIEDGEK